MPLRGARVLITRPEEDGAELASAIEAQGGEAILVPMIRIAAPVDDGTLTRARTTIADADWIALTSRHAAGALLANLPVPSENRPRVAVVGESTAERVRHLGWPVDRTATGRGAAALADSLVSEERIEGATVFYPRSDLTGDAFERRLGEGGANVFAFDAYRTESPGSEERAALLALDRRPDVIVFASPSAVRNLVDLIGDDEGSFDPRRAAAVAIGGTTAAALEEQRFGARFEAAGPDTEGLLGAVIRAWTREREGRTDQP